MKRKKKGRIVPENREIVGRAFAQKSGIISEIEIEDRSRIYICFYLGDTASNAVDDFILGARECVVRKASMKRFIHLQRYQVDRGAQRIEGGLHKHPYHLYRLKTLVECSSGFWTDCTQ